MAEEITYLLPDHPAADPVMWLMDLASAVEAWRDSGHDPYEAWRDSDHDPSCAAELITAAELAADALERCEIGFTTVPSPQTGETTTYCASCGGEGPPHYCRRCGRRLDVHWWPRRHWRCPRHGALIGEHHEQCGCRHVPELDGGPA